MVKLAELKETPCDILGGSILSEKAYNSSISYIPTMRIKKWKPLTETNNSENTNTSYCYMNTDDISINGNCSSESLGTNAFIKKVFVDEQQDATTNVASKKCVFEIDNTMLNDTELSKFWETLSDKECANVTMMYQTENKKIKDEIFILQQRYDGLIVETSANEKTIYDDNTIIAAKNYVIENLQKSITTKTENIAVIEGRISKLENQLLTDRQTCQNDITNMIKDLDACKESLTLLTGSNVVQTRAYAVIDSQNTSLTNTYVLKVYGNSNTDIQIKEKEKEKITKVAEVNNLQYNLNNCVFSKNSCVSNLATCKSDLSAKKIESDMQLTYWNGCKDELNKCEISYGMCSTVLPTRLKDMNDVKTEYDKCKIDLSDGIKNKSKMTTQYNSLSNQNREWRDKHVNCSACNIQLTGIKQSVADILAWCRYPIENSNSLYTKLMDAMSRQVADKGAIGAACEQGLNTLPTTIPDPKIITPSAIPTIVRGDPPSESVGPDPSCTVILSSLDCHGEKCIPDMSTYVKFDEGLEYYGTTIPPVVSIKLPPYNRNDPMGFENEVRKWAKKAGAIEYTPYVCKIMFDETCEKPRNNDPGLIAKWENFYVNQVKENKYKIIAQPLIYTTSSPGITRLSKESVVSKFNGQTIPYSVERGLLEVVQLIPNNGAYCSAKIVDGAEKGVIDAIDHVPMGATVGWSSVGTNLRATDNRGWVDLWHRIDNLTIYTGERGSNCSFQNIPIHEMDNIDPCSISSSVIKKSFGSTGLVWDINLNPQ